MLARNGLRRRLTTLAVLALATTALPIATASAQAPGLPRAFTAKAIDSPDPRPGGSFGWGLASSDLTGDGKPDLIVPQAQDVAKTQAFVFDGVTGAHIDTIAPPELNPPLTPGGPPVDPIIAFVYIETMPDIGSCPGGDGPDADKICDASVVGPPDGIPEIILGGREKRVNVLNPATDAVLADPRLGRGYVIDGKTRAVLKRIDMPLADRQAQAALNATPQFARVMSSPQALPPCAGSAGENNNTGVGPCPPMALASRIGDLDGGGKPDIVITARNFVETPAQSAATSQCRIQTANCTSGKSWAYSGEAIAGSNPQTILDTAIYSTQNPLAQPGGQEFGGNLYRIGDVNGSAATDCDATPANATCAPEYVITARNLSYPFLAPTTEFNGVGAAFLVNGRTGQVITPPGASNAQPAITSPEPQKLSQFSGSFNGGRAVGDLGASSAPDILLPAALQNAPLTDDGKIWAFNAVGGGGGATGSWQFASMTDPTPAPGGTFGGSFSGAGNLVDGPTAPANELLVGGFHFDSFTEFSENYVADVHFVNVQTGQNLMTIPNPDGVRGRGDGFGVGLVPMGDLNDDGFLDFAASSYLANVTTGGDGRAWIFYSDNSPLPPPPTVAAPVATGPAAPAAPAAKEVPLQPGACSNRTVGTDAGETLSGTLAGDEVFGFGGNDVITGYQGRDCLDGGSGADEILGGDDNDKLVGGSGNDHLDGGDERDELFGGSGNDRLDGGYGRDMLAGGPGNDRLYGSADADRLYGEGGADRIIGGGGRNVVDGGTGNDSIDVRNGERDRVLCGSGRDRVRADRSDRLNSCEIVTYGGPIKYRGTLPKAKASSSKSTSSRRANP